MDAFGFDESIHTNLDSVLDQAAANSEDLFSIAGLVHGHETRPNKIAKTRDVRPVTLVTLNSRKGKPKREFARENANCPSSCTSSRSESSTRGTD